MTGLQQTRETLGLKCPVCVDDAAVESALLEIKRVEARLRALDAFLDDVSDARNDRPDYYDESIRIGARFLAHEARLRAVS